MFKTSTFFHAAALCLAALALPLAAQNAALTGTVKDPKDAAIPNVSVTLTNQGTGVSANTKSDSAGLYEFAFVKPGQYSLKVEAPGFKTFLQKDVVLAVDERGRIDPVMQIGAESAIITVEANAPGVQTESSTLGEVVTNRKIVEIPAQRPILSRYRAADARHGRAQHQ